jgi:hypothetical protein
MQTFLQFDWESFSWLCNTQPLLLLLPMLLL